MRAGKREHVWKGDVKQLFDTTLTVLSATEVMNVNDGSILMFRIDI